MATRQLSSIKRTQKDWRSPTQVGIGCLVGALLMYGWMGERGGREKATAAAPVAAAPSVHVGAPVRAVRGAMTHPIIACRAADADDHELDALRAKLTDVIAAARSAGVTRAAVHVADLETCVSVQLGANELFHPASMMKVPLALAWLRRTGADPHALQQRLTYGLPPGSDAREDPNSALALVSGQTYTVEDLLRRMLVDSRNDAKFVLADAMPREEQDEIWRDLGLSPPARDHDPEVSVDAFALMFRSLYDGAWLGKDASELVLGWLAVASWKNGLVGQLPPDAVVAHKFGRRVLETPGSPVKRLQLHDCGILYRPGHPMAVCVMTQGTQDQTQERLLQMIGRTVWDFAPQ